MAGASDSRIWDYAAEIGAAIVTKDEDFARRRAIAPVGPDIVWIRLGNTRREALLIWFETVLPRIIEALEPGDPLIEVA
jgi:predicted nuclease of predicted toxin-antitoxin system